MAWHRTGTATITQGSDTVAGVGVNWMRQHVGWIMVTAASGTLHEIKEIISSTEVRLAAPVTDASASGLGYFIIPTHALNADLIDKINQMVTQFETSREAWQAVYEDFSAGPYQLWLDQGNAGTVGDFLASLKGAKGDKGDEGDPGTSAYQIWLAAGNSGDEDAFLDWFTQQALTQAGAARDAAQTAQGGAETARDAAQGSASQVASDRAAVAAIFDSFDDRYLGSKASDPLTDNDGDPLQTGAVYWNNIEGETRFYHSGNWERPSATAATSAQQAVDAKLAALAAQAAAETAQAAAEAAQAAAETAQGASETARDAAQGWAETAEDTEVQPGKYSAKHHAQKAQAHANAASLASNASEWVSEGAYAYGQNVWSPLNFLTYRAKAAHSGSTVDPSLDEVNFAPASGGGTGGGGGAQFAQFEVNTSGELILSFYDPAGAVEAGDFSINAAGELLLEIGL